MYGSNILLHNMCYLSQLNEFQNWLFNWKLCVFARLSAVREAALCRSVHLKCKASQSNWNCSSSVSFCHFVFSMHDNGQWTDWSWDSFPTGRQPNEAKLVKWTNHCVEESVLRKHSTLRTIWCEHVPFNNSQKHREWPSKSMVAQSEARRSRCHCC